MADVVISTQVAAVYDGPRGAAKVRLDVADVAALQRLRDDVLAGAVDQRLGARAVVDRGAFAERLATSLLRFEALTPHQRRALSAVFEQARPVFHGGRPRRRWRKRARPGPFC